METGTFPVRRAEEKDLPALAEIERTCFSVPWSEGALADTLHSPLAVLLAAEAPSGEIAGYMGMYLLGEDADVTNVAVLPAFRRQGIADAILSAAETVCRERGVTALHLEVRASNDPALRLYEKHGFTRDGVRRRYYKNPAEDAVLMTLHF